MTGAVGMNGAGFLTLGLALSEGGLVTLGLLMVFVVLFRFLEREHEKRK